jgi:hypothetical protein
VSGERLRTDTQPQVKLGKFLEEEEDGEEERAKRRSKRMK